MSNDFIPKGCSEPDCDFMGRPASGKCYAHELGKTPIMTLEEYRNQTGPIFRNSLGEVVDGTPWRKNGYE